VDSLPLGTRKFEDTVSSLLDADGYPLLKTPQVVKNAKPAEVETELRAQIERAQKIPVST